MAVKAWRTPSDLLFPAQLCLELGNSLHQMVRNFTAAAEEYSEAYSSLLTHLEAYHAKWEQQSDTFYE